jgi:hypothetical protein
MMITIIEHIVVALRCGSGFKNLGNVKLKGQAFYSPVHSSVWSSGIELEMKPAPPILIVLKNLPLSYTFQHITRERNRDPYEPRRDLRVADVFMSVDDGEVVPLWTG